MLITMATTTHIDDLQEIIYHLDNSQYLIEYSEIRKECDRRSGRDFKTSFIRQQLVFSALIDGQYENESKLAGYLPSTEQTGLL